MTIFRPIRAVLPAMLALPLCLAGCDRTPASQQDLDSLDRELTDNAAATIGGNVRDPALTAALADQIMVDPALTQSSNANAVRPPSRPDSGAKPAVDIAARADGVDAAALRRTPPASGDCPECKAKQGALTLETLAARQAGARTADCAAKIGYSAGWANRLPVALPVYPGGQVREAAGADRDGCALRIVSFSTGAALDKVLDYYYTKARAGGYSADHRRDGAQHVLGGTRGDAAYVVYVSARGDGTEVDLISNAGR